MVVKPEKMNAESAVELVSNLVDVIVKVTY